MNVERMEIPFGAESLNLEYGRMAKQADAAVLARVGGTVLLAAVTVSPKPLEGRDFFPLMVDYREKFYASGRIPGGFFKREGRPGDLETLRARIIDRTIRPLFPEGLKHEVMVYITIVSSDNEHPAEMAAINAASLALRIASVPFPKATAGVRVGRLNGEFILNPTLEQIKEGDLDLIMAGTREAINMVESGAKEISEEEIVEALEFGHKAIVEIIDGIEAFTKKVGKEPFAFEVVQLPKEIEKKIDKTAGAAYEEMVHAKLDKTAFEVREHEIVDEACKLCPEDQPELKGAIRIRCEELLSLAVRKLVIEEGKRVDGRAMNEVRPITCEAPILPSTHGSALFTRGQTQALGVITLGTMGDSQMMDTMLGTWDKHFLLQYNFPPFSVGEARPMRGPGRREIGHGALAERAVSPMLPSTDDFPYTIRMVSEILESNGSSSMATVCVATLAMMDAGIPLIKPVAGVAMGLIGDDKGRMEIMTDILGDEDHLGDMDFKVAGTRDGVTALQMDIKIEGVTFEIMKKAMAQAREGRLHILDKMAELLAEPRSEMAPSAPRVNVLQIPVEKIGAVIGPGGKVIRGIIERTGVAIDVQDDGRVFISSPDGVKSALAEKEIKQLTADIEIGQVFEGKVVRLTDFGVFVELLPGRDGMCHVSEMDIDRVEHPEDMCQMGDTMKVKVVNVDPTGKVRLSRKAVLCEEQGIEYVDSRPSGPRGGGGRGGPRGGGGGGRGGDRGGRGGPRGGGDRGGGRDSRPSQGGDKLDYGFRERPRRSEDKD